MSDDWETPDWLKDLIYDAYSINLDPCPLNGTGGLDLIWEGNVYVNPPFSDIQPWVEKAIRSPCKTIMLLPVRPSRPWWDLIKEYKILWLPRIRFKGAKGNHREEMCLVIIDE